MTPYTIERTMFFERCLRFWLSVLADARCSEITGVAGEMVDIATRELAKARAELVGATQ